MILPAILLLLVLVGLAVLHFGGSESVPAKVLLLILGLLSMVWYLSASGVKQPDPFDLETNRGTAIGFTLGKEAAKELIKGDEILLLTTSFPAWKEMSENMSKGVDRALKDSNGIAVRTVDVTGLEGGKGLEADGLTILRSLETQTQGADAIITAFPMMGENLNPRVLPKLPPVYGYYDGRSRNWLNLVNKKYFRGVAVPMIWREAPTDEEFNELEILFRQEYILVTPDNLGEFKDLR